MVVASGGGGGGGDGDVGFDGRGLAGLAVFSGARKAGRGVRRCRRCLSSDSTRGRIGVGVSRACGSCGRVSRFADFAGLARHVGSRSDALRWCLADIGCGPGVAGCWRVATAVTPAGKANRCGGTTRVFAEPSTFVSRELEHGSVCSLQLPGCVSKSQDSCPDSRNGFCVFSIIAPRCGAHLQTRSHSLSWRH
jgi:hypothetical protein